MSERTSRPVGCSGAKRLGMIGSRCAGTQRPRFVALPASAGLVRAVDQFRAAFSRQEVNSLVVGHQEQVFRQGIGIAVASPADAPGHLHVVRAAFGIDDRDISHVFRAAVARRKRGHDLVRVGDRFGIDHHVARILIAEIDHHARAVGIDRPEVMVEQLIAVDVLPSHVEHPAVGQHPGRVFLLGVVGEHANVGSVRVAAVERGHLGLPARHEAVATARTEDDRPVGRVDRLDIVVGPVGQLPEIRAVDVDFVEVVGRCPALAIGEEDLLAVVVDVRVADPAFRIVQQHGQLPRPQVEATEPSAVAKGVFEVVDRSGRGGRRVVARVAVGIMPEIAVPVVVSRHSLGKDDLLAVSDGTARTAGSMGFDRVRAASSATAQFVNGARITIRNMHQTRKASYVLPKTHITVSDSLLACPYV